MAAARDCAEATTGGAIDTQALEAQGWSAAKIRAEGETIETPLRIFGKAGDSPMMLISPLTDGSPEGCVLTGSLQRLADFEAISAAFENAFEATGKKADDRYFRIGKDIAILSPTGSRTEPSFRVAVLELGDSE
ncbi:hypothetical protein DL238_14430 [Alteriqipengyuania lutimaris]|uniref:Uncharacterized protein n=1 Tax=Alteriqipengyuania lutimaris TaxID=1538146 RepID=A0A395LGG9_9SPHN|nr:hypothetical protein DL238_14430 [Alteriqipengyuania lutimaris]